MGRDAGSQLQLHFHAAMIARDLTQSIFLSAISIWTNSWRRSIISQRQSVQLLSLFQRVFTQQIDGTLVCEIGRDLPVDAFGHKQLSGSAANLCQIIAGKTGLKTRAVEFSTLQRAATHIASLTDINEAFASGAAAVKAADEGKTGMMITINRVNDDPYQTSTSPYDIHTNRKCRKERSTGMDQCSR